MKTDNTRGSGCVSKPDKHETYQYGSNDRCAVCQYFTFLGLQYDFVGATYWLDAQGRHTLPPQLNAAARVGGSGYNRPRTFGAAAAKARELLAEGNGG